MNDEAGLLEAVYAAPRDPRPRWVYADWLLEQGNPLGRFLQARLRGDDAGARALLPVALSASPLPPAERSITSFPGGLVSRVSVSGVDGLKVSNTDAWRLVTWLRVKDPQAALLLERVGARLTALQDVWLPGVDALEALLAHRGAPLQTLAVERFSRFVDFRPLVGPESLVMIDVRGAAQLARRGGEVDISVDDAPAADDGPLEETLRALVRPGDHLSFTYHQRRHSTLSRVTRALRQIPHASFQVRELSVVG